jgi:hypothetical protein
MINWFKNLDWEDLARINQIFCEKGNAQYGFSESQGPKFKKLWEEKSQKPMSFWDMCELCRKLHEGAPFFNFNGNTFAAVASEASLQMNYPNQFILEDAICNAIAGSLSPGYEKNLKTISEHFEKQTQNIEF